MLKIIVNNQEVDLGTLNGLTLNYNPGIFENDSFEGSYTVPFTLPASDRNNAIFDFPYKMNNVNKEIREYPAELWHSGIKLHEGTVKASKFPKKNINCNFYIDNGNIYKDFNETMLNENDMGGYKEWHKKLAYSYIEDDFVLYQVKNPDYFNGTIYEGDGGAQEIVQNYHNETEFTYSVYSPTAVTPFPVLWKVLINLFTRRGFRYFDTFFSEGDYRAINIFNTVNAVESVLYESGGNTYTFNSLTRYDISRHLPAILTNEFIKAIQTFFNVKFYIRNYNCQVIDRKVLIASKNYVDISDRLIGDYTKENFESVYDGIAMSIQRDGDDANTTELFDASTLEEIVLTYNDIPYIEDPFPYKNVYLNYVNVPLNLAYSRYIQYVNQRDFIPTDPDFWFWQTWYYSASSTRQAVHMSHQNGVYYGEKRFEINNLLGTIGGSLFSVVDPGDPYILPAVKMPGNSYQHNVTNPFSLRLMMYDGIRTVEGINQPLGINKKGDIEISAYWSYYQRWKDYIDWWIEASKETYEMDMKFSAAEIKNFNFAEKKLINKNLFFITNMTVQLTRTEVLPAKCTLIKAI